MSELAIVRDLTAHPDLRGSVRETYRASWFPEVPPVKQLVRSESKANVLRGMHLHKKQWDVWHFVSGEATVRLFNHETGENSILLTDASRVIAIPPGISHGFFTESGCILLYALTEEYDGSDEYGFSAFDGLDDEIGRDARMWRDWPDALRPGLVMSERDLTAPRLSEFRP